MSDRDQVRTMGGALGWGVVARVARMMLGLFGSVLVVRGLGAYEYGVLAVIRTLLAFVSIILGGGLTQGLLRYLPAWRLAGERDRIRRVLWAVAGLQLSLWVITLLVVWVLRPAVAGLSNTTVAGLLILGTALLLPEVLGNTVTQVANAWYDSRAVSLAVVISTLAYVGTVAWFLELGFRVAGVLGASAISNAVLALWLLRKTPGYLDRAARAEKDAVRTPGGVGSLVRYSAPFLAIGLLNLITWRQSEVLFLGHFRGPAEAGYFDLAYRFPQMILEFVPGAIWPLVMAGFSEIYTRDRDALQRTSVAYYKLLFFLVAPLSVGGFLVGDLAIRLLYGPEFALSGVVCQAFFVIFSISFFSAPLGMILYVVERPGAALLIYLGNAVVNVGLDLLLIPPFGIWGAVIPVSVVILVSPAPYLWVLKRIGISIKLPWSFLGRVYAASALMLLLWPLRTRISGPWPLAGLVLAGVAVYVVGFRLFRVVGPSERALIERVDNPIWGWLEPVLAGRAEKPGR